MSYADPFEDFEPNDPAKLLPFTKDITPGYTQPPREETDRSKW